MFRRYPRSKCEAMASPTFLGFLRPPGCAFHFQRNSSTVRRSHSYAASAKLGRVNVISVGRKTQKEKWAEDAVEEYVKRLGPTLSLECQWLKDDKALFTTLAKDVSNREFIISMDAAGRLMKSSEDFSEVLFDAVEQSGARITFIIGGAEGLPEEFKADKSKGGRSDLVISLSRLTLTHKMARLVLVEQIYRATEIRKGTAYHK